MDSEKLIERKLVDGVKARGGLCVKFYSAYQRGVPDRIILMPGGRIYFVELKSTGKKPTKLQELFIQKLRDLGFIAVVIDTIDKLNAFMATLDFDADTPQK